MIKGLVLLGVIPQSQAVPGHDRAGVGWLDRTEDSQQRRLARAIEAEHDNPGALVDGQVDIGEDFQ